MRAAKFRRWLGDRLRVLADRIDWQSAMGAIGWSYTFEHGRGIVFHEEKGSGERELGCPLWSNRRDRDLAWSLSANGRAMAESLVQLARTEPGVPT